MEIRLSKKQYLCLLKAVRAGSSVFGILGDYVSKEYKKQSNEIHDLEKYLFSLASEFGAESLTEVFHGELIASDEFSGEMQDVMDDYDEQTFWQELEVTLGKRDFENSITEAEIKEMKENNGWYPDRIHEIYEKWSSEFEENGVDRLGIIGE
jgi:hypothetical protein